MNILHIEIALYTEIRVISLDINDNVEKRTFLSLDDLSSFLEDCNNVHKVDLNFQEISFQIEIADFEESRMAISISDDDDMFKFEYKLLIDEDGNPLS